MDLKELVEWKRKWQLEHMKEFTELRDKDPEAYLSYLTIALSGEVGEFANFVKKKERARLLSKSTGSRYTDEMGEELVDIFIYVLLLADHLDIDLEKLMLDKHDNLKEKFQAMRK